MSLSSPLTPFHYCYLYTNFFSWWIFTLCVCNFLCLESSLTFLYLMFRIQTDLWKQEDQNFRIIITKITNLSTPNYTPCLACRKLAGSWKRLWIIKWIHNSRTSSLLVQISKCSRSFCAVARSWHSQTAIFWPHLRVLTCFSDNTYFFLTVPIDQRTQEWMVLRDHLFQCLHFITEDSKVHQDGYY